MPQSKLNRLNVKGRMASSGGKVQVSGVTFEVDDLKGTGGITVTLGVPLAIAVSVDIDTMDLDSYRAAAAEACFGGSLRRPSRPVRRSPARRLHSRPRSPS